MKPTVLIYRAQEEGWGAELTKALAPLGLRLRAVTPSEYGRPIGELAAAPGEQAPDPDKDTADEIKEGMLVLCGLPGEALNQALSALKQAGLSGKGLKAVMTDTNRAWTSAELYTELSRERAAYEEWKAKQPPHQH